MECRGPCKGTPYQPMPTEAPIVLLDLDDVACPGLPLCTHEAMDLWEAVKRGVGNLEQVIHGTFGAEARQVLLDLCAAFPEGLRFVPSTSWRKTFFRHQIVRILEIAGLAPVARQVEPGKRWCTPVRPNGMLRSEEITRWLRSYHAGEPFVVLDDDYSGKSLLDVEHLEPWRGRVVMCRQKVGLRMEHLDFICRALREPVPRRLTQRMPLPSRYRP